MFWRYLSDLSQQEVKVKNDEIEEIADILGRQDRQDRIPPKLIIEGGRRQIEQL